MRQVAQGQRPRNMRALIYDGALRLGMLPRGQPQDGDALIRIRACAISRPDLDIVRGVRLPEVRPTVLGHQFVGEVTEVAPPAPERWVGRRVIAQSHRGCGRCGACRTRHPGLCESELPRPIGTGSLDGAFAEWIALPERCLVDVPPTVDDDEAVFAHPLSAALAAVAWIDGIPPQRVLVVGDGNLGLLVTLVLHAEGHTVSVLGRHPSRRDLLWRNGISFTGVHEDAALGRNMTDGPFAPESYGTVFECSGRPSGFELAATALRPRGRLVVLSRYGPQDGFDLRLLVDREIEVIGVSGGSLEGGLDYLARKRIDILPLVHATLPLQEGVAAFEKAGQRGALKVILRSDAGNTARLGK
jgi:threonine dehydrogenase-like Zn-dependent dehydrogenase